MTSAGTAAQGRVVVGVDGSGPSLDATRYAAGVAARRRAELLVVHVTPLQGGAEPTPMAAREVRERFEESAAALVATAADAARATGLTDVATAVVDDHPVDGLLALSAEAALLVIGRSGASGLTGLLLGSTASAVVQHASCPVVALPDGPVEDRGPVVVGVEGGPGDDAVLAFAAAEAAARGTGLTAVHAWRDAGLEAALGAFGPLVDWGVVEAQEREQLSAALAGLRDAAPELPVREAVVRARPAGALLEAAGGAQLLVVGHRHRGLLARLGSTTNAVLHRAACPVAVVPVRG